MLRARQDEEPILPIEQIARSLDQAIHRKERFTSAADLVCHLYDWLDSHVTKGGSYSDEDKVAWRKAVADTCDFAKLSVSSALQYFQTMHKAWSDGQFDPRIDPRYWPAWARLIQPLEIKVQAEEAARSATQSITSSLQRTPRHSGWGRSRKREREADSASSPSPTPAAAPPSTAVKEEPKVCKWHPHARSPHTTAECKNPGHKKPKPSSD